MNKFLLIVGGLILSNALWSQDIRFSYTVGNPDPANNQARLLVRAQKINGGTENLTAFNYGFYYKSSEATVLGYAAGATDSNMTPTELAGCVDVTPATALGWAPELTGAINAVTPPPGLPSGYDRIFIGAIADGNTVGTDIGATPVAIVALLLDISVGGAPIETDSAYMAGTDTDPGFAYSNSSFEEFSVVTTGNRLQTLPIQLTFFDAEKVDERHGNLKWASMGEINSSHFEIQRSLDTRNWQTIGEVEAAGYSNELIGYSFFDANVFLGTTPRLTVHYRLKMVDIDGRYDYSPIETLTFRSEQAREDVTPFVAYPNPAKEGVTIQWDGKSIGQPTTIQLFDAAGRLVFLRAVAANSNQEYIDFTDAGIGSGMCIARLMSGDTELDVKQIIIGQN